MQFREFRKALKKHFDTMVSESGNLFEVELDKDKLWELYLSSFPEGTNNMFRERTEHDCSACKQFIRNIGNAVTIKDNKVETVWNLQLGDTTYQPVVDALNAFVLSHNIAEVYVSPTVRVGVESNWEVGEDLKRTKWEHMYVDVPEAFVNKTDRSLGDIKGDKRDVRNVFYGSLKEINLESLESVLDLISQDSLARGFEQKGMVETFKEYKKKFDLLSSDEQSNFAWENYSKVGEATAKIKNHSIGTLLTNISEGMNFDVAVAKYEAIVMGDNYKRPKPIFTARMLEEGQKKINELGFNDSLARRYATLDDISINDILFSNRDAAERIKDSGVFAEMASEAIKKPKKFSSIEEVSIDKFIKDILPTATELEAYVENKHANNMVSLIGPVKKESKTMFKWGNSYGWAYTGNVAESVMKQRVKEAGGNVDGDLRFSIQWNDTGEFNGDDLDAHCKTAAGTEISFRHKTCTRTNGMLDVDIMNPSNGKPAVENITWADRKTMPDGKYIMQIFNYCDRYGKGGVRAEIEFDGVIYNFEYLPRIRGNEAECINVAEVTLNKGEFSIKTLLPNTSSSKEVWGLKTGDFVPVSVVMLSPNHWEESKGTGNKHFMFMLKGCVNPDRPNGFYNEFLVEELMKVKHVMEALGSKMAVDNVEDQLSGLGFPSTQRAELTVKVKGATERLLKIKF